jgi:hypothetical protein
LRDDRVGPRRSHMAEHDALDDMFVALAEPTAR